jgi:hypothetical protein
MHDALKIQLCGAIKTGREAWIKKTIGDWIMYHEVQLSSHSQLTPVFLLFARIFRLPCCSIVAGLSYMSARG